jgi:hypothetical protein
MSEESSLCRWVIYSDRITSILNSISSQLPFLSSSFNLSRLIYNHNNSENYNDMSFIDISDGFITYLNKNSINKIEKSISNKSFKSPGLHTGESLIFTKDRKSKLFNHKGIRIDLVHARKERGQRHE